MKRILTVAATCLLAGAALAADPPKPTVPPKDAAAKEPAPDQTPVTAATTVATKDIAYGTDPKQSLDLYAPKNATAAPVVMFIHGGEWTKGDKADISTKPKFFNENGIVFASINYRLTPAVKHPAHVSDVAAAIRWLTDNVAKHGGDPKKIVIMGHSAGCHLATLVTLDPRHLAAVKLKPTDIRGVVAWSGGMFDLVSKAKGDEKYLAYIRDTFGDSEEAWRDGSPLTHVKDAVALPPFLFAYVTPNNDSHKATETLAAALRARKAGAEVKFLENRTHRTANHLVGAADDTTGAILLDFIKTSTK